MSNQPFDLGRAVFKIEGDDSDLRASLKGTTFALGNVSKESLRVHQRLGQVYNTAGNTGRAFRVLEKTSVLLDATWIRNIRDMGILVFTLAEIVTEYRRMAMAATDAAKAVTSVSRAAASVTGAAVTGAAGAAGGIAGGVGAAAGTALGFSRIRRIRRIGPARQLEGVRPDFVEATYTVVDKALKKVGTGAKAAKVSLQAYLEKVNAFNKSGKFFAGRTSAMAKGLKWMGTAAVFLGKALFKAAAAALAFALTPLGAMLAALTVISALVIAIFSVDMIANWIQGVKTAKQELKEYNELLSGRAVQGLDLEMQAAAKFKAKEDRIAALQRDLRVAQGEESEFGPGAANALRKRIKLVKEENAAREGRISRRAQGRASLKAAHEATVQGLEKEISLLDGTKTKYELIENLEIRSLTRQKDLLELEKKRTGEAKKALQVFKEKQKEDKKATIDRLGVGGSASIRRGLLLRTQQAAGDRLKRAREIQLLKTLPEGLQGFARDILGAGKRDPSQQQAGFGSASLASFGGATGLTALVSSGAIAGASPMATVAKNTEMTAREIRKLRLLLETELKNEEGGFGLG